MSEKRKPHYALATIKSTFKTVEGLRISRTARNNAFALGLTNSDIVLVIQGTMPRHFYKSMTTHEDHTVWQDVYHIPWNSLVLYVKYSLNDEGHWIVQMKEK